MSCKAPYFDRMRGENMSISVYGTGKNAFHFILSNKNSLSIKYVISNDAEERATFLGIPVVKLSMAEKIMKNGYTVIASSEGAYWEIKQKIETLYDLAEFENFEYFETYKKELCIIYGNCHIGPIKASLKKNKEFSKLYGFYPFPEIWQISADNNGIEKYLTDAFQKCRLFIHQGIRRENIYGEEYSSEHLLSKLSADCTKITIPNVHSLPTFMFPQTRGTHNGKVYEGKGYFAFRDDFIDQNYKILSVKEISESICKDADIFDGNLIRDEYQMFCYKISERQKEWDIKPYNFLEENMQDIQLFFDPNYPTTAFLEYVSNELLHRLGMNENKHELWERINQLDAYEMPTYYSVANALGLKWKKEELRKTGCKLNDRCMDIVEYVTQYIAWNYYENRDV